MTTNLPKHRSRGSQLFEKKAPSTRDAAERIGCSKTTVAYLMSGERAPSAEMAEAIASAYGIAVGTWREPAAPRAAPWRARHGRPAHGRQASQARRREAERRGVSGRALHPSTAGGPHA
jgi:transcriptional regulator with XRE-family HTH domain